MAPAIMGSVPKIARRREVFPEPLEPSSAMMVPAFTWKEASWTTGMEP